MNRNKTVGAWGEGVAAEYLENRGYQVIARNYRCPYGEIDLILTGKGFLVFAEVKLRRSDHFAMAADFVDARKQNRIRITAQHWLAEHETELQPRFDVVEVYASAGVDTKQPTICHWEDAFQ